MSKITFRADEELVERIEARDASKSEIMREALREYLDASDGRPDRDESRRDAGSAASLDVVLAERVDELVDERLDAWEARKRDRAERARDVNVNVTLERDAPVRDDSNEGPHVSDTSSDTDADRRGPSDGRTDELSDERETACGQCGETLSSDHVYCPNCGEKASRRAFCECGDELRSDWGFCPGCGRRTPAADVLDRA